MKQQMGVNRFSSLLVDKARKKERNSRERERRKN
jgi:hypothetical protein